MLHLAQLVAEGVDATRNRRVAAEQNPPAESSPIETDGATAT